MSSTFYCKFCGSKYGSISSLCGANCLKSDTKKHQPYEGDGSGNNFVCKFCGSKASSVGGLCSGRCSKSPTNHHQPL